MSDVDCTPGREPRSIAASIFFLSSPNLSGHRLDVYHTSTHGCGPSANLECGSETCCACLAGNAGPKNAKKSPSGHHHTSLSAISSQLRHVLTIGKKLVKQQYLLHMSHSVVNYDPLAAVRLTSLGHHCKFQHVRILAVLLHGTSSGRQPNFAALNRGLQLYSAGRPSRWALVHISSLSLTIISSLYTILPPFQRPFSRLICIRWFPSLFFLCLFHNRTFVVSGTLFMGWYLCCPSNSVEALLVTHRWRSNHNFKIIITRIWANAQRDGRPADYRLCPLFNAPKFGWRPLLECRAVTLPRHKIRWNLQGCPKLANRSQPLVGRSSPYYEDMWRRYLCLTSFFSIVDICLDCEDTAWQSCAMVPKMAIFTSCISASCVQHISDMHSKFALRPHHV